MRRAAVYAGTRAVYDMMAAAAKSLLAHTRMDRVYFMIEDDEFQEALPDVIKTINVSDQPFFPENGPNYASQWTYMSLMRLVLSKYLPERRVLWLDVDTIVQRDIGGMFDLDLGDNVLAMVKEPARSTDVFTYHNSGVMLMDLQQMYLCRMDDKCVRLVNRKTFTAPDQDALNLICQGEIYELGPQWNAAGCITADVADPYIRHYAGYQRQLGRYQFEQYKKAEWRIKT